MKEFDIESIWEIDKKEADTFYDTISTNVEGLAKKKSNGITRKLKIIIYVELLIGVLSIFPFVSFVSAWGEASENNVHDTFIFVFFAVAYLSYWLHIRTLIILNKITGKSIMEHTKTIIHILKTFIYRITFLSVGTSVVSIVLGIYEGYISTGKNPFETSSTGWKFILITLVVAIITALISFLITSKIYIPLLYGKLKSKYEKLLTELTTK